MDPITIALICAAAFGTVVAFSAFLRQVMLSRDKTLNDESQRLAIAQEAGELEKMRNQMQGNKRFDSHYKVLGANKDAITYLDSKIEDILNKKTLLVERYAQMSLKESGAIVDKEFTPERKGACDRLKQEIDDEIKFYDSELEHLQKRRGSLWDTHTDLQEYLLGQEKSRNDNLDNIYKRHSGLLEKIYIRHAQDSEHIAKQSIDAGTSSFKMMILAPIQFLLQYFNISSGIALDQAKIEQAARDDVDAAEKDMDDAEPDVQSDDEANDSKDDAKDDADADSDPKLLTV